jgi:hypothetical protein
MEELIGRIPKGSKLVFIVNHSEERPKFPDRGVAPVAFLQKYHRFVSDLTRKFDYVGIAMVSDVIKSVDDMMAGDHYAREVYSRLANLVVDVAESLVGRSDSPHASQPGAADASAIATRAGQSNLHETPVPVRNIVRAAAAFVFNLAWTGRRTSGAPPK